MSVERSMYDYCPKCRCSHCIAAKKYITEEREREAELVRQIRRDHIQDLEGELGELRRAE